MTLAERIARDQVGYWRGEGITIADCLEALGYAIGPRRHHGRTWAEVERIVAEAWVEAVRWQRRWGVAA